MNIDKKDWFARVAKWNEERDNLTYNSALEYRMLSEELAEYSQGASMLDEIEQIDAICDLLFVALGTLAKMAHSNGFDAYEAMEYVLEANEAKPKERVNGKIVKGETWIDPKEKMKVMPRRA